MLNTGLAFRDSGKLVKRSKLLQTSDILFEKSSRLLIELGYKAV